MNILFLAYRAMISVYISAAEKLLNTFWNGENKNNNTNKKTTYRPKHFDQLFRSF